MSLNYHKDFKIQDIPTTNLDPIDLYDYAKTAIHGFVAKNPYPSYEKIMEGLQEAFQKKYCGGASFSWMSEYGHINHEWCKTIYENITNKDKVIEIGRRIGQRGGLRAMQANWYIMYHFSPLIMSKNEYVFPSAMKNVERYWSGIGEWIA